MTSKQEIHGTFDCPVCGWPNPHSHTDAEIAERPYIDGARKAFEAQAREFMCREYFKSARTGYWYGFDAYMARRTDIDPMFPNVPGHGWAQRDYPSGRYSNEFVDVQWQLWRMAWLASSRQNIPPPDETSCVGWIDCGERLPAHGLKVMAFYRNQLGKGRTVFAQHIEKFKDCADNYDYEPDFPEEFFDTDESGTSWVPEGWYEVTETHENNLQISDAITHWRPLLAAPEHPKTTPAHIVKQEPLT